MAYGEAREAGPGRIILIGVLVSLAGLGLIAWLILSNPYVQDRLGISPEQRTKRALLADPVNGRLFQTALRTYPGDFASTVATVINAKGDGATESAATDAGKDYLQDALAQHQFDIPRAPHAQLVAMRQAQLRLLQALAAADPKACAEFMRRPRLPDTDAHPKVRDAAIAAEIAFWEAAAAGRDHGVQLTTLMRDPRDGAAFVQGLHAEGLTEAKIRDIATHGGLRGAPPVIQCEVGMQSLRAFDHMPTEQADRLFRVTMGRTW